MGFFQNREADAWLFPMGLGSLPVVAGIGETLDQKTFLKGAGLKRPLGVRSCRTLHSPKAERKTAAEKTLDSSVLSIVPSRIPEPDPYSPTH